MNVHRQRRSPPAGCARRSAFASTLNPKPPIQFCVPCLPRSRTQIHFPALILPSVQTTALAGQPWPYRTAIICTSHRKRTLLVIWLRTDLGHTCPFDIHSIYPFYQSRPVASRKFKSPARIIMMPHGVHILHERYPPYWIAPLYIDKDDLCRSWPVSG